MSPTLYSIIKQTRRYAIGIALCLLMSFPLSTHAATTSPEQQYRAALLQMIELLQQQITLLQAELAARSAKVESSGSSMLSQVTVVQSYVVNGDPDLSRITDRSARAYFAHVYDLFPDAYDKLLGRLVVFQGDTNGVSFDAFVETIPPDHTKWLYAVQQDVMNDTFDAELVIHELGHMVSYQAPLGVETPAFSTGCAAYFSLHGCPAADTYLRQFVDRFWSTADLDRAERFANVTDPLATATSYYKLHQAAYVSDYATLSPEEDFSESFVYFIFGRDTEVGIAEMKVDFFARFPELLEMKREMRAKL